MISLLASLALSTFIARVVYLCYFHPLARYPGPFLARFTNIWRFLTFLGGQHHLVEQRLHDQYGPVVRVAPNWLSLSHLEDFEAIYGFNKFVEKGDFYTFGRNRGDRAPSIFSTRTDAAHRQKKRKVLPPALSSVKVARYDPIVVKHVDAFLSRIEEASEPSSSDLVNLAPLAYRFTMDTMLELIFGPALGSHPYTDSPAGEGICSALRMMSKMAWSFSLWPAFGWIMNTRLADAFLRKPTRNRKGDLTGMSALMPAGWSAIFQKADQTIQSPQPGIVKSWLEVPSGDANHMEKGEILSEAFNVVFAGPGSTAATLTALVYQLGTKEGQVWQEKLRQETPTDEPPTSTSIPLVLQAVIKETLRFNAAFPTAFPRVIMSGAETVVAGLPTPLPVGTTVSGNSFVLGRSREIWGDTADQWLPQRWLGNESQRRDMDNKLVAFSKGARGCIGKELAWLVIARAAMAIIRRWRFEAEGELQGKSHLEMQYDECWISYESL